MLLPQISRLFEHLRKSMLLFGTEAFVYNNRPQTFPDDLNQVHSHFSRDLTHSSTQTFFRSVICLSNLNFQLLPQIFFWGGRSGDWLGKLQDLQMPLTEETTPYLPHFSFQSMFLTEEMHLR